MPANARGVRIFEEATTTSTSSHYELNTEIRSFQAVGWTSAGSGAATILLEGSNVDDNDTFLTLGTITLVLGTTKTSDAIVMSAPFKYTRARITAISGTDATIDVYTGYWPS